VTSTLQEEQAMSTLEPFSPWAESTDESAPHERQLSQLFAKVPEPVPLADFARQRVALRLRARASRGASLLLLRLVAVGVVIGVAGAAAAQWASVHWFAAQETVVTRNARVASSLSPQPSLPRAPAPETSAVADLAQPAPEPAASAAFPAPVASAASSRLGQEAASLEAALSALKAGGKDNASRALQGIDQHLQKFPRGALELEARVARVDALLVLGRRQEAGRELSALPIENVGRKNELRLIRAELRADDDCRAALNDFQVLVDQSLPTAWAERALFGRGACLLKLGDKAAADRDFTRYLERFPNGRFAGQIRAQGPQ
jgi:TolA-binding protein